MSTLNIQLLYRRLKRFPLSIHHFLPNLAPGLILNGSNYPYLEQIFMVPKRFEPLRFDCIMCRMYGCGNGIHFTYHSYKLCMCVCAGVGGWGVRVLEEQSIY